tara:strand:+ start:4991 stop:5296 length:306 start_codon:yes stop_codon:yes gene_type:complete
MSKNTIDCKNCGHLLYGSIVRYNEVIKAVTKRGGVVQRLVDKLCIKCWKKETEEPTKKELDSLELIAEYIRAEVYKSGDYEDDSVLLEGLESVINKIKESN